MAAPLSFCWPQAFVNFASASFAFSCATVVGAGAGALHSCASCRRCARQYCFRHTVQFTPGCVGVLIVVLHFWNAQGAARRLRGFGYGFGEEEEEVNFGRSDDSQFPAFLHECAVSVRCSRQYVPLQDSHTNGRKSSCLQVSTSQCEPMPPMSAFLRISSCSSRVGVGMAVVVVVVVARLAVKSSGTDGV
jgi:hypothetical protein